MFALNNLKLSYKIALITGLAIITFLVTLAVSIYGANSVKLNLNNLQTNIYPLIKISNENSLQIQRVEELYTQAVSTAEEDLLTKAKETGSLIKKNISKLIKYDPDSSITLNKITEQLNQYEQLNIDIAKTMLSDNIDFEEITAKAEVKSKLYKKLTDDILAYQQNVDTSFRKLINNSIEHSEESIYTTIIFGAALLALMVFIATLVSRNIARTAGEIAESLLDLANGEGDLSQQLKVNGTDELGQVSSNFNKFMKLLQSSISDVVSVVTPLNSASSNLKKKMSAVTLLANEQESEASNVNQSMLEMQKNVYHMAENAVKAVNSTKQVEEEVAKGQSVIKSTIKISNILNKEMDQVTAFINTLSDDAGEVNQFLNVIDDISDQTNLLALNAAIEAARAGEHGRGFAVVADEVRTLASRTSDATNNIKALVVKLGNAAQQSVDSMSSASEKSKNNAEQTLVAGEALELIQQKISEISKMSNDISISATEQEKVSNKVMENMEVMTSSVESTRLNVQEVDDIVDKLTSFSESLRDTSSQFKLGLS
ncbi:MAG: methyl-accepting chemotaxis protein [Cycloclasticus sp.]|nr:methyl-accepting chemotaxis protein [Cycloclasticus sp.]